MSTRPGLRRFYIVTLALLALAGAWLLLGRSPIDAAGYRPAAAPALTGPWAPNHALQHAELLARGQIEGGEDVAVDGRGRLYTGTADGRIVRITPAATAGAETVETFAQTGGRPLGLRFAADGTLIVCDAERGLLAVSAEGAVRLLTDRAGGLPFAFTDDLDIAADGTVYFTDASHRFGHRQYLFDLLESRPHGRLLAYHPDTGTTTVVRDGLYFANGVALSRDQDFVLVNETYRYRIQRCWLAGPRAGRCEPFADNLPGFPDNLSSDGAGTFWVALFTVRNRTADRLHPYPRLKNLLARLPRALWPKPASYGLAVALDESGAVLRTLHDPSGAVVRNITSVEPHGDALYLGTLHQDWIARWRP